MKKLLIITTLLVLTASLSAQSQLKRKGALGIQPVPLNDSLAREKGLNDVQGLLIAQVFPNSTAEMAGLLTGDVLLGINLLPRIFLH